MELQQFGGLLLGRKTAANTIGFAEGKAVTNLPKSTKARNLRPERFLAL